ncbi:MAG: VCBS repeat-containing protein [Planctomycetota bacterium]|nr:VCBS repeat-containing protein [Planctomycetota bacterium]
MKLTGALSLVVFVAVASAVAAQGATISNGSITVTVNDQGLLVGVPPGGIRTYDGLPIDLTRDVAEWFGVSYDVQDGHHEYVGTGKQADWAATRAGVRKLSFTFSPTEVLASTLAGDLLVDTWFHFDDDGDYLLAAVTLTNVGPNTVKNIFYTREWGSSNEGWSFPFDMVVPLELGPAMCRRVWMFDDLPPGATTGAGLSYVHAGDGWTPLPDAPDGVDVPLSLWTNAIWPAGLVVGATSGISFGDYDADGYTDIFALSGGNLFRNEQGQDWTLVANLAALLPFAQRRYGSSFGDYDNDGLPDIGCEPRDFPGDTCLHLFHNLGGGPNFQDVATDPAIIDVQACNSHAETICWGDTDGDGNMDFFLPVYPAWAFGGPGNFFYYNLGPVGPGGAYAFTEMVVAAGLDNPPLTARPEGAQFVDTDFDGDFDLYCNGALYRNVSVPGTPLFQDVAINAGIEFTTSLEEGIVLFDFDMDGDFDLCAVYSSGAIGVRIFEAQGDGSYSLLPTSVVDSHTIGLDLGISTEDWDNDGDMDLTTRQVFRRNQLVETGVAKFTVASHTIPFSHITSATPAWGDWDKDGDLDCALGNWLSTGHFYENTLYDETTPDEDRRYVRVRVMRDSDTVPFGLENEYGAIVEIHVEGEENGGLRRKKFVSSSAGYLNQNEYVLHFALPDDPDPGNPAADVVFDVTVDLAGPPQDGFLRIDKHVNPALGGIQLAELEGREIIVYRSGKVVLDGCELDPTPAISIVHTTTTGGLAVPTPTFVLSDPVAVAPDTWAGIEIDTVGATGPTRVVEVILDGRLDGAVTCGGTDGNLFLWDITTPGSPVEIPNTRIDATTHDSNRRSYLRTNMVLEANHVYRLVARVTEVRGTAIAGPVVTGPLTVTGGLVFNDTDPCSGTNVEAAIVDPTRVAMAVRFNPDAGGPMVDFGFGVAGASGVPQLTGSGPVEAGSAFTLDVTGALPNARALLVTGFSPDCKAQLGGTTVPAADVVQRGFVTDGAGSLTIAGTWPDLAPGETLYFQVGVLDPAAVQGFAISNAIAGSTQP